MKSFDDGGGVGSWRLVMKECRTLLASKLTYTAGGRGAGERWRKRWLQR